MTKLIHFSLQTPYILTVGYIKYNLAVRRPFYLWDSEMYFISLFIRLITENSLLKRPLQKLLNFNRFLDERWRVKAETLFSTLCSIYLMLLSQLAKAFLIYWSFLQTQFSILRLILMLKLGPYRFRGEYYLCFHLIWRLYSLIIVHSLLTLDNKYFITGIIIKTLTFQGRN